jgi:hypothetical protein
MSGARRLPGGRALVAVLLAVVPAAAQGSRTVFDILELDGIARALEARALRDRAKPQPSKEFEQVIQSRPDLLSTPDGGKTWRIRPIGEGDDRPLTQPSLKPDDFACAVSLLQLPYVKQYVHCMKETYLRKGRGDCLKHLVELAQKVGDGSDVLLAGLQARVFTLASQNRDVRELAFGIDPPAYMREMARAYRLVETQKLFAAGVFKPGHTAPGVSFLTAGAQTPDGDVHVFWTDFNKDFLTNKSFKTMGSRTKLLGWRVEEGGKVVNVDPDREFESAGIYTCEVAPDHQIIVSGKLSREAVLLLRAQDNVQDILKVTGGTGARIFLSRPGSSSVGYFKQEK